jgi:hypothetical protein
MVRSLPPTPASSSLFLKYSYRQYLLGNSRRNFLFCKNNWSRPFSYAFTWFSKFLVECQACARPRGWCAGRSADYWPGWVVFPVLEWFRWVYFWSAETFGHDFWRSVTSCHELQFNPANFNFSWNHPLCVPSNEVLSKRISALRIVSAIPFPALSTPRSPVFHIEYPNSLKNTNLKTQLCGTTGAAEGAQGFWTVLKNINLDGWVQYCNGTILTTSLNAKAES